MGVRTEFNEQFNEKLLLSTVHQKWDEGGVMARKDIGSIADDLRRSGKPRFASDLESLARQLILRHSSRPSRELEAHGLLRDRRSGEDKLK